MIILHIVIILRTQGKYVQTMFDQDQLNLSLEKEMANRAAVAAAGSPDKRTMNDIDPTSK